MISLFITFIYLRLDPTQSKLDLSNYSFQREQCQRTLKIHRASLGDFSNSAILSPFLSFCFLSKKKKLEATCGW